MENCIKIKKKDGKMWIFSKYKLKIALNLYQPSSNKGKIFKKCLPFLESILIFRKILNKVLKIEECQYTINSELESIIRKVFNLEESRVIYYSVFLGTPCVDQKTTIQIYDKRGIIGYCKITDKDHIMKLFKNEQEMLDYFNDYYVKDIPRCLYCGKIKKNLGVFIQTTTKSNSSKTIHKITKEHISFLKQFCDKTQIACSYDTSDYFKLLSKLENNYSIIEKLGFDINVIDSIKKEVNIFLNNNKWFSAYHGDFTPWNTFFNNKEIFAFDFEYAERTFPKYIDIFHFFTQIQIYEKNMNAEQIYEKALIFLKKSLIKELFDNPRMYYKIYLLSIIVFYLERDKNDYEKNQHCIKIWIELLILLK